MTCNPFNAGIAAREPSGMVNVMLVTTVDGTFMLVTKTAKVLTKTVKVTKTDIGIIATSSKWEVRMLKLGSWTECGET